MNNGPALAKNTFTIKKRLLIAIPLSGVVIAGSIFFYQKQFERPQRMRRGFNKMRMLERDADVPLSKSIDDKLVADTLTLADLKAAKDTVGEDIDAYVIRLIADDKLRSMQNLVRDGWKPSSKQRQDDVLLASIRKPEFLKLAMKNGANPDGNFVPRRPLAFAAGNTRTIEPLKILLEHGANPNVESREARGISGGKPVWSTPLLVALTRYNEAAVRLLLKHGAQWKVTDSAGRLPIEIILDRTINRSQFDPIEPYKVMIGRLLEDGVISQAQANEALAMPDGEEKKNGNRREDEDNTPNGFLPTAQ